MTPPVVTLPGESPIVVDGDPAETPATPDPSGTPDPTEPPAVEPELTLPGETSPPPVETPAEPEPDEEPTAPVAEVVPAPAAVPVVAIGIAPGCVDGTAVLVQKAQNQDTKGVSVNFLANADFATSGSLALLTAPDALGRDQVTVTSTSGKAYVGAGSVSVRTYRAGQTLGGVTYPAVSETRKLAYDAFTCERPAVLTNVKTQLVNGQVHLAQYARNTGNTTLQVKFNATAHFAASVSFSLAPGEAKYFLVPTQSASVPSAVVSVNVVTNVQGSRISLNQNNRYDALSVATPN
ncbi:hypothetical protein JKP76_18875 [Blastococcus sp. TML/C7B]|uniref:hypothetical protein n=1 Tax=Blastococcus sp. TML/C7B TaxID=2798728 RepID=UPI00190E24EA|nr:hypothetical protein [Blastococcus sp. TML/C7B]MBN1097898.1 hypothetical protein [Blastococcus sp. TML/C7B]